MLRTKSILLPLSNSDGLRISVMTRRGAVGFPHDLWLKDLAPPDWLFDGYCLGEINLSYYLEKYFEHLQRDINKIIVKVIANYALHKRVTLLGMESVPTRCHRTILLYECLRYESGIHSQNF